MDKNDLRHKNLALLRNVMRQARVLTKPQAAELSGLSVVTVNALLKELLAAGEVLRAEEVSSSGGRPAQQYVYNARHRLALTVYMHEKAGRDTMFIALQDMLGNALEKQELQPEHITIELFQRVLQPYFARYSQITAVVVGLPGMEVRGRLAVIDYPELQNLPFCALLEEAFGCPVYLENDINAAVLGCTAALGEQGREETVVGIYLPQNYPPGAGISLRGKVYKGRDGMAGEIGSRLRFWSGDGVISGQGSTMLRRIAELIVLFAVTWNPHRLILYHECLQTEQLETIRQLAADRFAQEFLPELEVKSSIYEDYGRGIAELAMEYLHEKRNGE